MCDKTTNIICVDSQNIYRGSLPSVPNRKDKIIFVDNNYHNLGKEYEVVDIVYAPCQNVEYANIIVCIEERPLIHHKAVSVAYDVNDEWTLITDSLYLSEDLISAIKEFVINENKLKKDSSITFDEIELIISDETKKKKLMKIINDDQLYKTWISYHFSDKMK